VTSRFSWDVVAVEFEKLLVVADRSRTAAEVSGKLVQQ
jgi:hypothetical protein